MTFLGYYRLSSMLLVLTGFFAIMITGNYLLPVVIGMMTTFLVWISKDRLGELFSIPKWAWNALALVFLIYFTYDSFLGELDLVGNGIKFVVYLQVVKLLSPKTNRDQIQIYLLSFLHVLASSVLSTNVTFAFPFVFYIVLATWTLSLFNIKVRYEESLKEDRRDVKMRTLFRSRDIITPKFLVTTSLLSVSVIAFTLLVFFSFPRVSFRNFLQRSGKPQSISGFSEQVELGTIGTIKTNNSIAIRVEVNDDLLDNVDIENLYWRGTAADYFDGRVWSKTWTNLSRAPIDRDTWEMDTKKRPLPGWNEIEYRVFLEALSTPILFGADRLMRVMWDKSIAERMFRRSVSLGQDEYSGYRFFSASNFVSDLTYRAISSIGRPPAEELRQTGTDYPHWVENYYFQMPDLDPKVAALLKEIPVTAENNYDKTLQIVEFLESNYEYTVDVEDMETDNPLRFFFIERKRGHCEYHSTALIVALRFHGIPARQVMGFRGGQLNPYGRYIAVRQSDAHTWVEAYFPKYGWIRFDPSPPDASVRPRPEFALQSFYQVMDYLRLRWNKYIIEYDMAAQASAIEKIGQRIMSIARTGESERKLEKDPTEEKTSPSWKKPFFYVIWAAVLAIFVSSYLKRRRRFSRAPGSQPLPPYIAAALRLLGRKGFKKPEGTTLREFAFHVEKQFGTLPSLHILVDWYYAERFGDRKVPVSTWKSRFEEFRRETTRGYQENRAHRCEENNRQAA